MPSKTSKPRPSPKPSWKAERACGEARIASIAAELARELRAGDRVILEGPMGVGKSTFARALLHALGVHQPPEGSPTFAIAHEYESPRGGVLHVDFYRIRSEDEIDEAGITAYLWERELIVITEWLSMFEEFQARVLEPGRGRNWQIALAHSAEGAELRDVAISKS